MEFAFPFRENRLKHLQADNSCRVLCVTELSGQRAPTEVLPASGPAFAFFFMQAKAPFAHLPMSRDVWALLRALIAGLRAILACHRDCGVRLEMNSCMKPPDSTNGLPQPATAPPLRLRNWALFGALLLLCCFGWLARAVWVRNGFAWDAPAIQSLHRYATPARDRLMVWVTNSGDVRTVIILAMIVALGSVVRQRRKHAHFVARCVVGTVILGVLAKAVFHRVRPHFWESPAPETDFGFPSGHSMHSLALTFALAAISWRTRWRWPVLLTGIFYVLSVGFSRLYLGVHYPSDVLGGWALAMAWLITLSTFRGPREHLSPPTP